MKIIFLFAVIIILSATSCFTNRKHFMLFRELTHEIPFKTNGMYYQKNANEHHNLVFYKNGLCNYHELYWGVYKVENESMHIQFFYIDQQNFYRKNVIDLFGKIINDTTVSIKLKKCIWCKNVYHGYDDKTEITFEPERQYFFKNQSKPDSTQAWFLNKKWFLKGYQQM